MGVAGGLIAAGFGAALGAGAPLGPGIVPPVPIVQAVGGSGTGGSEFDAYSIGRAFGVDDGVDREPSDYFEPEGAAESPLPTAVPSWADQLARTLTRFWVPRQSGAPRGPTVHIGGASDAGKVTEHWAVHDLLTAGAKDAGKIQETWESPDEFTTAGAKDAGKIDEKW
jgi:hypothetical protein